MPSSGYGRADLLGVDASTTAGQIEEGRRARYLIDCAEVAMRAGLFVEWLESFVAAREQGADVYEAARAGIVELDL